MAAIDKQFNIKIDSKSLVDAFKSIKGMEEASKEILKLQQSLLNVMKNLNKTNQQATKMEKEKIEALKSEEAMLLRIKKIREDFAFKRELSDLEKPRMGILEQAQKYKGASGAFKMLRDQALEKGEAIKSRYDEQVAIKQEEYNQIKAAKGAESPEAKAAEKALKDTQRARSKAIGDSKTQAAQYAAMAQTAAKVDQAFEKVGKAALKLATEPFKKLTEGVKAAVVAMLDFKTGVATFNTSTSLITNASAREQQLKYGLTSTQNYAFTRAKEMLNIQSDEDLMYMNKEQRDRFLAYMENYSKWYDEMAASGVLNNIQELQLEFNELKNELAMDFLSWVAANKEELMIAVRGIFEFIKVIAKIVLDIVNFITRLSGGRGNYGLADLGPSSDNINNTSNNIKNTTININANTTNNATGILGSQEAFDQYNENNWSNLAKQIVEVIGG